MDKRRILATLALLGSFFAFGVIALGAFTRLVNAGLGCPDWPGCYGHLIVPMTDSAKQLAQTYYPNLHLETYKAWAEMIHRYFVGGLSLFLLAVVVFIFVKKELRLRSNIILAISLVLLLLYQILLGRYTVTLKLLPIVVTLHLLGGFFILSILWLIYLNNAYKPLWIEQKPSKLMIMGASFALLILVLQIALGAWTSTNYASLSCTGFPFCMKDQNMVFQFKEAFTLFAPIGINYEGGVLSESARQTIQMTHRLGALIFTLYMIGFMAFALPKLKQSFEIIKSFYVILGLLILQLSLGIANVIFKLPLPNAISHNLVGVLLLLAVITLLFKLIMTKTKVSQ